MKRIFFISGTLPILLLLLCLFQTAAHGQDSLVTRKTGEHSPHRAALFSAVLPGLGQAYNKKYWKIPIIYGAAATVTWFAMDNHRKYRQYREAYIYRTDGDSATKDGYTLLYTDENLRTLQDSYRRYRDLDLILLGVLYALNIIDATVDAHMYTFDVSDDLSLRCKPILQPAFTGKQPFTGFSLTLRL